MALPLDAEAARRLQVLLLMPSVPSDWFWMSELTWQAFHALVVEGGSLPDDVPVLALELWEARGKSIRLFFLAIFGLLTSILGLPGCRRGCRMRSAQCMNWACWRCLCVSRACSRC